MQLTSSPGWPMGDDGHEVQPAFQHVDVFNALLLITSSDSPKPPTVENPNHQEVRIRRDHQAHAVSVQLPPEPAHEGIEDGRRRTGLGGFVAHAEVLSDRRAPATMPEAQ